jgi:hypothetical protein
MSKIIGDITLARLLNRAVKERYQQNRPFLTLVIEADGRATVHSNMDVQAQMVELLENAAKAVRGHKQQDSGGVIITLN